MKNPKVGKRQLEIDRKEKAERKRQRRVERSAEPTAPAGPVGDQSRTLQALASLHAAYEAGTIAFDDFEVAKRELIAALAVE